VILEPESEIQPKSLPDFKIEARLRKGDKDDKAGVASLEDLVANYERDCIMNSLADNHYSLNQTADFLKVSRHSLRYRMHRLNIKFEHGGDDDTVVPEE
jgi:transcriptional regulator with PAS, ATPase and Fis domain